MDVDSGSRMQALQEEIRAIQNEIKEVKDEVTGVKGKEKRVEAELGSAKDQPMIEYLRKKEEDFRRDKELLRAKENLLLARLKDLHEETKLLLVKQKLKEQAAGSTEAATTSRISDADTIRLFEDKLREDGVDRPNQALMSRCITRLWTRVLDATRRGAAPGDARSVYQDAKVLFGSRTHAAWRSQAHLSVNGPWIEGRVTLLTAVDLDTGALHVMKVLPRHEEHHIRSSAGERGALEDLQLATFPHEGPLVRMELVSLRLEGESALAVEVGPGKYEAMKMRRFVSVLSELPQLSEELIFKGAQRLVEALDIMHEAGRIHCDVKAANVLVNEAGAWYLGDYGASVKLGETVWSCTQQFYPAKAIHTPADPRLDWGMMTVLLMVEQRKSLEGSYLVTTGVEGVPRVSLDAVLCACRDVKHRELRGLLEVVVARAGWQL